MTCRVLDRVARDVRRNSPTSVTPCRMSRGTGLGIRVQTGWMARLDDIELVRRDYSDPSRLEERFRAWREYHDPDMLAMILAAVAERPVRELLEVGCGDGRFSEQLRAELPGHPRVVAL